MSPDPPAAPPAGAGISSGRSIADAAVVLLVTRLASILLAWVLEVVLVRLLEPPEWNSMSRFVTLIGLFSIAQFGFPESVLYFVAKATRPGNALLLTARTSAVLGGAGLVMALPFFASPALTRAVLGSGGGVLLAPLVLFVVADLAFSPLPSLLLGQKRPRLASALSIGTRVPIVLGVAVAIVLGLGLQGVLWGLAGGAVLALLCGWVAVVYLARGLPPDEERVRFAEQLRFSMPIGLARLVQVGNVKLDKYIVMTLFAESVYGAYYLAATEFPVPGLICSAVITVMMADLVRAAEARRYGALVGLWHASINKIALVVLPVMAFLLAFADPLFVALYGPTYGATTTQFRIFQLLLLARVTSFTNVSLALGQPRVPLIAAVIAFALNVALSFAFIPLFGISGPALANVTANYLSAFYTMWAIRRGLRVSWSGLFPLRRYLTTLLVAFLAAGAAAPLLFMGGRPWLVVVVGALVHAAVFLAIGTATSIVGAEDRAFLRGLVRLEFFRSAGQASREQ